MKNYFGRLTALCTVVPNLYKWKETLYDLVYRSCAAPTNQNIVTHFLRAENAHCYMLRRKQPYHDLITAIV